MQRGKQQFQQHHVQQPKMHTWNNAGKQQNRKQYRNQTAQPYLRQSRIQGLPEDEEPFVQQHAVVAAAQQQVAAQVLLIKFVIILIFTVKPISI